MLDFNCFPSYELITTDYLDDDNVPQRTFAFRINNVDEVGIALFKRMFQYGSPYKGGNISTDMYSGYVSNLTHDDLNSVYEFIERVPYKEVFVNFCHKKSLERADEYYEDFRQIAEDNHSAIFQARNTNVWYDANFFIYLDANKETLRDIMKLKLMVDSSVLTIFHRKKEECMYGFHNVDRPSEITPFPTEEAWIAFLEEMA